MSTRFYLPTTGNAAVSPAFDAAWGVTAGADTLTLSSSRSGSAFATKTTAESTTSVVDVLSRQYISEPLVAQTISGTVKAIIRASENTSTADARAQVVIRVVNGRGDVVRGTLLAASAASLASEFGASLQDRKFPLAWSGSGASVSSVAAQTGDRLVVEIGWRAHNTASTSRSASFEYGDAAGSDLPEDETGTSQLCPWVELSATLAFLPKVSTLVDNFDDGSIDGSKWSATGGVSETGGAVVISPTSSIPLLQSTAVYDAYESSVTVHLAAVTPDGISGTLTTGIELYVDASNAAFLSKRAGNLIASKYLAGVFTDLGSTPYLGQLYWRFRHAAGVFYWEVSSNGSTWSQVFSTATANLPSLSACIFLLYASQDDTEPSPGTAQFDTVNYFVTDKSAGDTGAGTDAVGAVAASRTAGDTGAGTDAVGTLAASRTVAETASGADAPSTRTASIAGSQTATAVDAPSTRTASIAASDTSSGTDTATALVITTPKSASDAITSALTETALIGLSTGDVGTGTDGALRIALSGSETATGVDTSTAQGRSGSESGVAVDVAATPPADLASSEVGSGVDAVASLIIDGGGDAELAASEAATGSEDGSVAAAAADNDSGAAVDAAMVMVAIADAETGNGLDGGGGGEVGVPIADSDTGSGLDVAGILNVLDFDAAVGLDQFPVTGLAGADNGVGVDAGALLASFFGSETGVGVDAGTPPLTSVSASEVVTVTDEGVLVVSIGASDFGAAVDIPLPLLAATVAAEVVAFTDGASLLAHLSVVELATMAETTAITAWLAASDAAVVYDNGAHTLGPPTITVRSVLRPPRLVLVISTAVTFTVVATADQSV